MKKVLIIAYYFPPSGGAGVQRILRFIKYLPQLGWQPVVLTVKDGYYPTKDCTLLDKIPHKFKIYRTFIPEPYQLYRKFISRNQDEAIDLSSLAISVGRKVNFRERIAFFIRSWLFIPDSRVGWLPFAILSGLKIVKREKIDLIFSSAPPNTVHLIAYALKKLTGKKWVADFRDPWFKYLALKRYFNIPKKIDNEMCKLVVKNSDYQVWVCEGVKKEIQAHCGEHLLSQNTIIYNGFDEKDFDHIALKENDKFTISYIGSLYIRYDFNSFIEAIEQICKDNHEFKEKLRLVFCGAVDEVVENRFRKTTFRDCLQFLGYQSHSNTLEIMAYSTLLLLYIIDTERGKNIPTSKLYEYLGVKKPILALAPEDSEAAMIINKTKAGVIVPPNDPQRIKMTIIDLYKKWKKGLLKKLDLDANEVEKFEIKNLTKRLVHSFDETATN